jgi:hypothetical protein
MNANPFALMLLMALGIATCPATNVGLSTIEQPVNLGAESDPARIPLGAVATESNYHYGRGPVITAPRPSLHGAMEWKSGIEINQNLASIFGIEVDNHDLPHSPATIRLKNFSIPAYSPYTREQVLAATIHCILRSNSGRPKAPITLKVTADSPADEALIKKYSGEYINAPDNEDGPPVEPTQVPGTRLETDARGVTWVVFQDLKGSEKRARPPVMIAFRLGGEAGPDDPLWQLLPVWTGSSYTWEQSMEVIGRPYPLFYDCFNPSSGGGPETNALFSGKPANAVRYFGGVPRLLNFDNLKAAVIKADWYDPAMNPKLADFCRHYGMTPMPCRSYTPEHKGKVERGVGYAKNNALKGRQFASLGEQNAHLLHWEEQVADKRVHGTTRRQVAAMFEEERKALGPLPASVYESYQEGRRRVQRDSFVEVAKAYYEAPPEFIGRQVWVRWDGRMVRLLNERMEQIGCHAAWNRANSAVAWACGDCTAPSRKAPTTGTRGRRLGRGGRSLGAAGARCPRGRGDPQHHGTVPIGRKTPRQRHQRRLRQGHGCRRPAILPDHQTPVGSGRPGPGQIQMELREVDPIIRPLSAYADFIRSQDPAARFFPTETRTLTEPQTTSKAS